jgi:hypothetical protein
MPRPEVNRSGEMEVFVRAVELGGFSPAARALRMTPSAVSKLVARLERRLGARLINRSTRKITLTAEGGAFLERAHRVLADLDEAERAVAAGAVPRGLVRINCNVPFGAGDVEEVNVVYMGHGGRLPARVRAFIDFLVEEVELDVAPGLLDTI